jgi:hypothetical protein
MSDIWSYYHCIKKNRIEPYICVPITDILSIPVPHIEFESHIVPICKHIPAALHAREIKKKIIASLRVEIAYN